MKLRLLAFCLLVTTAFADTASHRRAATELLALAGGSDLLLGGMETMIGPMEDMWRQQGAPEDVIVLLRGATRAWMTEDIKWSELEPKIVDLYVRDFTEAELREVIAFYKTPTGQKALKNLPLLMAECAKIGQDYGMTKQDALRRRIEAALEKYETDKAKP